MYQVDSLNAAPTVAADPESAWRAWCDDVHGAMDVQFERTFSGLVCRQRTSTYQLVAWTGDSEKVRRSARGIRRDPRHHLKIIFPVVGPVYIGTDDIDVTLDPGQGAVVSADAPFTLAHDDNARVVSLLVPASDISPLVSAERSDGRVVPASGLTRIIRDVLVGLYRERNTLSDRDFDAACERIVDLLALATQRGTDVGDSTGTRIVDAVQTYIKRHASDPNLSLSALARDIGWSRRYIQATLAERGLTVTELVRNQRMENARRMLGDIAFSSYTITAIATRVGFQSPSAFSSAFRAYYGYSPREARQSSVGHGSASAENRCGYCDSRAIARRSPDAEE